MLNFTVDLRTVNKYTIKYKYAMPNFEQELTKVQNSMFFCDVDFIQGYWQILLEVSSQELMSLITQNGIMTLTRIPYRTINAMYHIQAQVTKFIAEELQPHTLT